MNKRIGVVALLMLVSGCASYTQSKIDLTAQAQRGIERVRADLSAQQSAATDANEALRGQLDTAFDQDVASRDALDADWVIIHRKAYATAIDAFDEDRRAADAATDATLRTLDAIAAALTQLQQMHADELRLTLPEVKR